MTWISTHRGESVREAQSESLIASSDQPLTEEVLTSSSMRPDPVAVVSSSSAEPATVGAPMLTEGAPTLTEESSNARLPIAIQVPSELAQFPVFALDMVQDIIRPLTSVMFLPSGPLLVARN